MTERSLFRETAWGLLAHAAPILVAQLASIGMMVVDTAVLGHVSAPDLAAVAIGGGIHVSVVFALVGIVQAVGPLVARQLGAGEVALLPNTLQQGFWLALALAIPGIVFLNHPGVLLRAADVDPVVADKVRDYLEILAYGLVPALAYRTFYAFCNAIGRPRVLMGIGLASLLAHAILAWGLATGAWTGEPLGVAGCALSNVVIAWAASLAGAAYLWWGEPGRRFRPLRSWAAPRWSDCGKILRLGVPMGLSNLVEITSFTLISLLIASLGATAVAGHRIVANLAALCYMLPLSLGIAVMSAVGQALGAHDRARVGAAIGAAALMSAALSTATGLLLWWLAEPLVAAYTDDRAVSGVALTLVGYVALYQFFDALQTIAGHALRAFHITFVPMLVQIVCFWGIGLGGGWWLCYRAAPAMGVAGFWLASLLSLIGAALLLGPLLWKVMRLRGEGA